MGILSGSLSLTPQLRPSYVFIVPAHECKRDKVSGGAVTFYKLHEPVIDLT